MTKAVILDNGHGVDTKGKRSPVWGGRLQLFEWEFNRDIVRRIREMCDKEGLRAYVLVPESEDVSLPVRCRRANAIYDETGGECFLLSIHANAGGGTGWECFTSVGKTKADDIAQILADECTEEFGGEWRIRTDYSDGDADKESQFYILTHTKCPAVLSENFFMDTERDCRFIMSEEGRERIAMAHFRAIRKVINNVKFKS